MSASVWETDRQVGWGIEMRERERETDKERERERVRSSSEKRSWPLRMCPCVGSLELFTCSTKDVLFSGEETAGI